MSQEQPPSAPLPHGGECAGYKKGLHWLAIATAVATFPLIFMGGLVTSNDAGLAVPNWPNSFGYNMFLFPTEYWWPGRGDPEVVLKIFYEHTHRLAGTLVGLLSIAMVIWALVKEKRVWVRWLAVGVLAAVIFQGVLGGLRVIWRNLDLAIVHACAAQAFFCLTGLMVAATSRWWTTMAIRPAAAAGDVDAGRLVRMAAVVTVLIYLQLVVGAVMRHYRAGLAIPDFPLTYGRLVPPLDSGTLNTINEWRSHHPELGRDEITLGQIWIHFAHRVGAVIVTLAVLYLAAEVLKRYRHQRLLVRPAKWLIALVIVQFALGVMTVLWRKPADIATAHVALGALVLFTTFILFIRGYRLRSAGQLAPVTTPEPAPESAPPRIVPRPATH